MTMHTYTVTFGDKTFTRRSEASYTHAVSRRDRDGFRVVSFHGSHEAAARKAGAFGSIKRVEVKS